MNWSLRDTALPIFLALWMALTPAFAGSMSLLGVGGGSSALPGPPTFTFQGVITAVTSTPTITFTNVPIGTASSNRFIAFTYVHQTTNTVTGATVNASSAGVTVYNISGVNQNVVLVTATGITTGTTATLVLTYSGSISGGAQVAAYTTDVTTLSSTTPTLTGTTVASGTTITLNYNVASSGSSVICLFRGTNGTISAQAFAAPNTATVVKDTSFGTNMYGHANAVAANGSSQVSATWTTSAVVDLGCAVFR